MPAEGASNAARRRTGSPIRGSRPDLGRRAVRPRLRRRPSGSGPGPRGAMTTCSAPPGWTCRGAPLSRARRFDKSSKYHQKQQAIVPRRSDTVGAVRWGISSRTRGFPREPESCRSPGRASDHVQRSQVQILPPLLISMQVRAGFAGHRGTGLGLLSAGCLLTLRLLPGGSRRAMRPARERAIRLERPLCQ
jgi:hypothetical protein